MIHPGSMNGFESGRVEAHDEDLINALSQRILVIADAMARGKSIDHNIKQRKHVWMS